MDEPVASRRAFHGRGLSAAVEAPTAAVGDCGDLLDVDVDQLTGPVALVADDRSGRCTVADVEATDTVGTQDALHRRRGETDFVANVVGAPPALSPQFQNPDAQPGRCRSR